MRLNIETRIDEITGLPYVASEPTWVVVIGPLAYSQHKSEAAAHAWIKWHMMDSERKQATVIRMG